MRQRENKSVIDRNSRIQTPRCGPTPERGVFAKTNVEKQQPRSKKSRKITGAGPDPNDFGNKSALDR